MADNQLERFFARIIFTFPHTETQAGREMAHIYNREDLNGFCEIPIEQFDKSQFIKIGDKLTLEGKKCEVKNIMFNLHDHINIMSHGRGVNLKSPTPPTDFNCSVVVIVDWVD